MHTKRAFLRFQNEYKLNILYDGNIDLILHPHILLESDVHCDHDGICGCKYIYFFRPFSSVDGDVLQWWLEEKISIDQQREQSLVLVK